MRLCSGCGTVLPDSHRGQCADCTPGIAADDGIRSHAPIGAVPSRNTYAHLYRSPRWTACSKTQRSRFRICEHCNKELATLTDHFVPASIYIELCREVRESSGRLRFPVATNAFYDAANLQSLCDSCHRLKTLEDDLKIARGGPWPTYLEVKARRPPKTFKF
jgi:5-methylcytosine-specific restriction endonuclease McrA